VTVNASKDDNEETLATWVECNRRACRAHYIVYLTESLNVKPKCHYCRTGTEAPVLECSKCFNRVIWPEAYRTSEIEDFECYACRSGRKTIVDMETTAKALSLENSTEWLLRNEQKIAEPLNKRSLFHTISTAGTEKFCEKVQVFPDCQDTKLVLNGKPLHNAPSLIKELESWVLRRRTELGTCSLCFSSRRKVDLHLACGRSGCPQRVCDTCLRGWYGLNAAGRIINTAALSCPFCRRSPTTKTLVKYGAGIHAVADLQNAVTDAGKWIHAWCVDCGYTKRYIERVCAAGAPAELSRWSCEDCVEGATKKLHNSLKDCPECGVVTQKSGGCNHITCNCGTHWCWHCGKKCSVENIYHHMNTEHGGIYGGPGAEDADTDGEEDVGDW
jgi:predicted nucleic-acid-binding Zn-ribbon protein